MREASLYVPFHMGLGSHRKLLRLARAVGVSEAEAIGRLYYLWCASVSTSGILSAWQPEDFAAALRIDAAERWIDALIESRFLDRAPDGSLSVHDWHDYMGRASDLRAANRERQRRFRERRAEPAPADEPEPHGVVTPLTGRKRKP